MIVLLTLLFLAVVVLVWQLMAGAVFLQRKPKKPRQ